MTMRVTAGATSPGTIGNTDAIRAEIATYRRELPRLLAEGDLIKKKHAHGLSAVELVELAGLQDEMLRYRQKVAPLPLDEARRLHQELLTRIPDERECPGF